MKKRNKTWFAVVDKSRNNLVRITSDFEQATSTNSVLKGSTIHKYQAKTVRQAIRTSCADIVMKATKGCLADHGISYGC